jgi:hypothetical protein
MAKTLDPIANNKNQKKSVIDLRTVYQNLAPKKPVEEKSFTPKPEEIKISPKLSSKPKLQPIWWTIQEKYHPNSWLSIMVFVFSLIFLIVAFFEKNWIFFAIIILANVLFILYFLRSQKTIFRLTENGVYINEDFYSYNTITHFWILETDEKNFIIFATNRVFESHLFVPFKKEKTEKIREFLKNFLKEKEIKPSLIDLITNIL